MNGIIICQLWQFSDNSEKNKTLNSTKEFINEWNKYIPFKFNMDNLLVTGWSVSNILIFMYSINNENANELISMLINYLDNDYSQYLNGKNQSDKNIKTIK